MVVPLKKYRDLNLSFLSHPLTGDVSILTEAEAVKRSVRNLCLTGKYERFFQPHLGAGLPHYLFENVDVLTSFQIRDNIIGTINRHELRARLDTVDVQVDPDNNKIFVKIQFYVETIREPQTVDFFLERTR